MGRRRAHAIVFLLILGGSGAWPAPALAERLAARKYTTADGLAGDYIISLFRDSRGFLWFGTRDGLSRFDGVRFTSYGARDGLPSTTINHMVETRSGVYWVGTNGGGLCRFDPSGRRPGDRAGDDTTSPALFTPYRLGNEAAVNRVNIIYEDREGRLWIGTDGGLFRAEVRSGVPRFERVHLDLLPDDASQRGVHAVLEDRDGGFWIGGGWGLSRLLPDGRTVAYRLNPAVPRDVIDQVKADADGRVWLGSRTGLLRLQPASAASFSGPGPFRRVFTRVPGLSTPDSTAVTAGVTLERAFVYTAADGLPDDIVGALYFARDGHMWAGTARGVAEFDGHRFFPRGVQQGLSESLVREFVEDASGGLWIATVAGATRLLRDGLVTYDGADGLENTRVHSLAQARDGRLFVVSGNYDIGWLDGARFTATRPAIPAGATCAWLSRCAYLDSVGGWWLTTSTGLHQWHPSELVGLTRPAARVISSKSGLRDDNIFSVFEDRAGRVWIATGPGSLYRLNRDGTLHEFGAAEGLPPTRTTFDRVSTFAEDRQGNVWLGFDASGLVRYRGGRFEQFRGSPAAPPNAITALLVDGGGRLWVGSSQYGLARVDDPGAETPRFVAMTSRDGLSTDNVRCLIDDERGRIYVGTSRGIDRFDPATSTLRHFSISEGLASDFVTAALRDQRGDLWFGTINGLSRLTPRGDGPALAPPSVFISTIRVGGAAQRLSDLGDPAPPLLTLAPDNNQLEIGFFGLSFDAGAPLRYQYRLEGTGADWTSPAETRSVNFARLAAGSYRFLVRAVRSDGVVSATPAMLALSVPPPIYARWWFVSLVLVLLSTLAWVLYRVRVEQLLRVERVRARIATDLHDDIGASLSQIAILAEVARERLSHQPLPAAATEPLSRIAETSRGLVDSMSDIVWAINPDVDTLSDLVHRVRRFVEDTLGSGDVEVVVRAAEPAHDVKLGADVRREVFLILKESVTNIAKHAQCSRVHVDFECVRHHLRLRVADNGRGFDPGQATDGNGVANLRRRVAALGGTLRVESAPGRGTTISFDLDLRRAPGGGE